MYQLKATPGPQGQRQCDQKKIAKCVKKLPKNDFIRKMIYLPLQKLPKNVGDLGNLIAAKGFKKLSKVQ